MRGRKVVDFEYPVLLVKVPERLRWEAYPFLHPREADKWRRKHTELSWLRYDFSLDPAHRCSHVNRFGVRCFHSRAYDGFCGLHNTLCWDARTTMKHPWKGKHR